LIPFYQEPNFFLQTKIDKLNKNIV